MVHKRGLFGWLGNVLRQGVVFCLHGVCFFLSVIAFLYFIDTLVYGINFVFALMEVPLISQYTTVLWYVKGAGVLLILFLNFVSWEKEY